MPQNRFKQLREKNGLSQIELGNRLGVTQQSVFAWERGLTTPAIQTAIALSRLYNVSLDYLLGLSDIPEIQKPAASDSELKDSTMKRLNALPEPVLEKVLDLLDVIQEYQAPGSKEPTAPASSAQSDPE